MKAQNGKNIVHILRSKWRNTVFKAWLKSRKDKHTKLFQSEELVGNIGVAKQRRALEKWFLRVQETKRIRCKWAQFHANYRIRMKRKVFEVIQWKQAVNYDMAKAVGHLEYFMRTKMQDDAFKDIKSYSRSKKLATSVLKRRAALDTISILTQRHEWMTRAYFGRYKKHVFEIKQRQRRLKAIFGKFYSQMMHTGFRRWWHYTQKHMDAQEMNETGPVTEQVFEGNRLIKNLRGFMKTEGYPEEQIKRIVEEVKEKETHKIRQCIARWQIFNNPEKRLQIKAFDHFATAIKMRKILRYWLNFSNNRVVHVKADMQEAFRKWALGDSSRAIQLDTKPLAHL